MLVARAPAVVCVTWAVRPAVADPVVHTARQTDSSRPKVATAMAQVEQPIAVSWPGLAAEQALDKSVGCSWADWEEVRAWARPASADTMGCSLGCSVWAREAAGLAELVDVTPDIHKRAVDRTLPVRGDREAESGWAGRQTDQNSLNETNDLHARTAVSAVELESAGWTPGS